jgi:RNA polymerase sigma factor (sigma-70 family)
MVTLEDTLLASGEDPLKETEKGEMLERLFAAIDELNTEEKAIILATEFEGRSYKHLAKEWGVPLGTLLARKSRGLEKIRKRLTGQFNDS